MPLYRDFGLSIDADQLHEDARDFIEANAPPGFRIPVWMDWVIGAVARMGAEVASLASVVPGGIFRWWGELLGVNPNDAVAATGTATFTVTDTTIARTVPAGTQITIEDVGFETTTDLFLTQGGATSGTVAIVAITPGADGNGLQDPASIVFPTSTFLSGVTIPAATAGGVDAEDDDEFLDRFADTTPTLSRKAILIEDFAALTRDDPEVYRALAIDNYNPGPPVDTGAEGHVSVFPQDESGQPVSAAAKSRISDRLFSGRVLNLIPHVLDPTYTSVDIAWTATAYAGYDKTAVRDAGNAAIAAFLDNARWGNPDTGDEFAWVDEPTLRRNDLFGVLYSVEGIRHVDTLTLALHGAALTTADVSLATPAALPVLPAGQPAGTVT